MDTLVFDYAIPAIRACSGLPPVRQGSCRAYIDEATAISMTDGFAAGMTNTEGTCGALIGVDMVLGLVNKDKAKTMKQMRTIMQKFQDRNHATQCRQLKGVDTHVVLRPCPLCVADACEFLEDELMK